MDNLLQARSQLVMNEYQWVSNVEREVVCECGARTRGQCSGGGEVNTRTNVSLVTVSQHIALCLGTPRPQ